MSMTVGSRTVTVGGHYKSMTQESLADGIKVVIDGHVIIVTADQLTVDGNTQVLEPGQDVEVLVDKGRVKSRSGWWRQPTLRNRAASLPLKMRVTWVRRTVQASLVLGVKLGLERALQRPDQRLGDGAVVAHLEAHLAVADAEQLDDRRQPVVVVERDDAELHRRHEFAALRLGVGAEAGAEGGIEPEQLEIEQLADEVEGGRELEEAFANRGASARP